MVLSCLASGARADDAEREVRQLLDDDRSDGAMAISAMLDDTLSFRSARAATPQTRSPMRNAQVLPAHHGYVVRDPHRAWGTSTTISWFMAAFDAVGPDAPAVMVHDLSSEHGGPLEGHRSHQDGRDVDLAYYRRSCADLCEARAVGPDDLDSMRQWQLLRYWLERNEVEFVFVDYALQGPIYRAAEQSGATAQALSRWFQYPAGRDARVGIVRHVDHHDNHLHVRFRCQEPGRCSKASGPSVEASDDLELEWFGFDAESYDGLGGDLSLPDGALQSVENLPR